MKISLNCQQGIDQREDLISAQESTVLRKSQQRLHYGIDQKGI